MSEKGEKEGERKNLEEITNLLADIVKKVTDRGATTLHAKLNQAMDSFHGELKRIDEELEKADREKK
jgi:flagellar biosynthesis/type III secretory pathway protein FliH